ncbi:hypothetical protein CPC08DRAFT_192991 [Agrocybe pediades]|nr:hypothetical protein CPC08DRAFT_192991 [Agrocybe pediades]
MNVALGVRYLDGTTLVISGLAPTLMVARLFGTSAQEDPSDSYAGFPSDLVPHTTQPDVESMEQQYGGDV